MIPDSSLPSCQGIYLIHFARPYGKRMVQHYLGWSKNIKERVCAHRKCSNKSARLLVAITLSGIEYNVVKIIPHASAKDESEMKKQKKSWAGICPCCNRKE